MALTCGFFNSYKGDRKYDAEQMSSIFDGILKDGIIPSYGQLFDVNTANNGMQVTVGTGRAWFNHTWTLNDSVMILNVPQSDITRPRYDTVVLEVNHEQGVRENFIKIVSGVPAVNAAKPILLDTDKVKQYPLAHILVKAGTEEIKAEDIENMVGRTPTVFATGILETAPIDDLWSQWEGEWRTWFEGIKLQLSGDIVTNLQLQIDRLREFDKTVLTDSTKALYGLSTSGTPDDIFQFLYETSFKGHAFVKLMLKDPNGNKLSNFGLKVTKASGNLNIETNERGEAIFVGNSNETFTITAATSVVDLSVSISDTFPSTGVKEVFGSCTYTNYVLITSSRSIKFSDKVESIDYAICGGGGGGGSSCPSTSLSTTSANIGAGNGGGGGYVVTGTSEVTPYQSYSITVGSGGSGGPATSSGGSGTDGGSTSFMGKTANGGGGGTGTSFWVTRASDGTYTIKGSVSGTRGAGNGTGGQGGVPPSSFTYSDYGRAYSGSAGGSGSGSIYTSYTEEKRAGGGGGGAGGIFNSSLYDGTVSASGGSGGSPNGGKGGSATAVTTSDNGNNISVTATNVSGSSGSIYGGGGGGGGGYKYGSTYSGGGSGASGCVTIRIHHKI